MGRVIDPWIRNSRGGGIRKKTMLELAQDSNTQENVVPTRMASEKLDAGMLDNIIDDQAMQIKLTGLTKNITTTREPSNKELNDFYQQYQEQYRQISSFQITQYLFTNVRYGGQAISMAQKTLTTSPTNRTAPQDVISLNSIEIERLYGAQFSKKLVALVLNNPKNLPCWTKPITSKVGAHLLCFKQVDIGAIPKLESVKPQLINHWRYETAKQQSANKNK